MFSIDENNKITLTKGDLASFNCIIANDDGEVREPQQNDVLTFSIDGTEFSKNATIDENKFVFVFNSNDTKDLAEGVYFYRVILNSQFTLIQECFLDLLGDGEVEEEQTEEPTPTEDEGEEP